MFSVIVHAQSDLRPIVYGNKPAKTKKTGTTSPKPAVTPKRRKPAGGGTTTAVTRKTKLVPVVFTTQEARAEIWLNNRNIGFTDGGAQLRRSLAPGIYQVLVKKGGQIILPVQSISVTPEQTDFMLVRETPKPTKPATTVVKVENPKPKTQEEIALEMSQRVKETLENYADPTKTGTVTTADWELVLQAAQLGQLQGYTAVQIEAQRWFASGQIEMAKGNYPNAFTAFNKAQEYMPNSALPFLGLGNAYLANKQPADALKAYQRAIQMDSKMAMAYRGQADALRILEREKESITAYKNAIQLNYRTPETRYYLAVVLSKTGKHPDAIKELEDVTKEAPTADAYVALGNAYQALKRDVSALEAYRKATETDPNSAVAFGSLGDFYLKQREHAKAKEALEKAVALDPEGKSLNLQETQKKIREAASRIK
ncbi:MAG TPA: tetratricopeptide repeat protein [Pyrinomonadaceae bacterium]|nr:tetratricopeptide repeat protein [Pyrinomonadaceae bacterium]